MADVIKRGRAVQVTVDIKGRKVVVLDETVEQVAKAQVEVVTLSHALDGAKCEVIRPRRVWNVDTEPYRFRTKETAAEVTRALHDAGVEKVMQGSRPMWKDPLAIIDCAFGL